MAKKDQGTPTEETLKLAIERISNEELSYRQAELMYGIPKSTLHDHKIGKVSTSKKGPSTVLSSSEEDSLVQWILHMADIGYGRTREQVCLIVKKILDKDGRANPFTDNYPGKDWWYAFLRRHPQLSVRLPESLQLARASSCTPAVLDKWYKEFEEFTKFHNLQENPQRIWNADESGFPLCPKTSRVIALKNQRHVYGVTSDTKTQITTLVAANAAGNVIPPMHVFPGIRFRYNPLEGCVEGAYFGRSDNGWMVTELFYGWLANHFIKHITSERPVLLLVDGHTTHIDIETSKFCMHHGILLYCLPPHSSHATQPLDVGFFGALKSNWKKAVNNFQVTHLGLSVTNRNFAQVFKVAWTNTVKMSTIVNSFAKAGIYPLNRNAIGSEILGPAKLYESSSSESEMSSGKSSSDTSLPLKAMEAVMDPKTVKKYNQRYLEGYDVSADELYVVWKQLKELRICKHTETVQSTSSTTTGNSKSSEDTDLFFHAASEQPQVSISNTLDQILVYPQKKSKSHSKFKNAIPSHLSSLQIIEQKARKRAEEEEEKERRKAERLAKKKEKEEAKARKLTSKRRQQASKRTTRRKENNVEKNSSTEEELTEELTDDNVACPVCKLSENNDREGTDRWVACDHCLQWYHIHCTSISPSTYGIINSINWMCENCSS